MDIDESSNFSDMSIDLKEEAPLIKNIDEGASLEESPEYVEDIDNHLRKMEVRILKNMAIGQLSCLNSWSCNNSN